MNSSPQKAKTIIEVVAKIRNKLVVQSNLSMRNREDIFKTDKYGNIKTENEDINLSYQYGIADVKDNLKEFLLDKKKLLLKKRNKVCNLLYKDPDDVFSSNELSDIDANLNFIDELWGADLK